MSENNNPKVKSAELAIGVSMLGSKQTLSCDRNYELEATPYGIQAHSKATGRTIVIPYTNVRGYELLTQSAPVNHSVNSRTEQALKEARADLERKAAQQATSAPSQPVPQVSEEEAKAQAAEARAKARQIARETAEKANTVKA